jgi:fibronectin type 3 domain-containing protein
MNLQANPSIDGVNLTWVQDDYDTLMGYNIYRSETKDGNYIKLNNVIIPSNENTFIDENAEPGKSYWYTFTVVLSDMTESIHHTTKISFGVRIITTQYNN